MKKPISFGSLGVEVVSSMDDARARPARDAPFRICILGDFSGRTSRGVVESLKGRAPVPVDRDTVDEVLARAGGRAGGSLSLADAVSALRLDRARH